MRDPNNSEVLPIEVITVEPATGEEISRRTADYGAKSTRQWLEKHVFWAWYQGKGVAINPIRLPTQERPSI